MRILLCLCICACVLKSQAQGPWNHKSCAVVLTYDDAINVDLDNVLPALDSQGFKGTFYLITSSPVVAARLNEWRAAAREGHELGNHTLFHPCAGGPGRGFVQPDFDLRSYTVNRAVAETRAANTMLQAIDGKTHRTFAYPCGDLNIRDSFFYAALRHDFAAARGVQPSMPTIDKVDLDNVPCYAIMNQSADAMIGLVKQAMLNHGLLVFLFHGVGGGHSINEGLADHSALLHFLKAHESDIWIAPMVDVADFIRQSSAPPRAARDKSPNAR